MKTSVFAQYVQKGLSKTTKNLSQDSRSGIRSKPGTSQTWSRSVMHSAIQFCSTVYRKLPKYVAPQHRQYITGSGIFNEGRLTLHMAHRGCCQLWCCKATDTQAVTTHSYTHFWHLATLSAAWQVAVSASHGVVPVTIKYHFPHLSVDMWMTLCLVASPPIFKAQ